MRQVNPERSRAPIPQTIEIVSLLVALALVLTIAVLTYQNWTAYNRRTNELAATHRLVGACSGLLSTLKDAETGERGFLLTGKDSYLDPYRAAVKEVPQELEEFDRAVEDRPDQAQRVAAIKPLVQEELDEFAKTIDLRRTKGAEAALAEVASGQGNDAMDQIRKITDTVQLAADERLKLQTEEAGSSARRAGLISVVGSVALFALLGLSIITIHRATRRRQELISELQETEEQARQGRDWLQTILGSIGDGVIATDAHGLVDFLNPVAQSFTGWTQAEAAGLPLEQVFVITDEKSDAIAENPIRKALREETVISLTNHTVLTSRDGRRIPIDDTAAPIRNSQGEVIGGVLVFRDVINRRRAELFEAGIRERYRFFAEASQDLSSTLDYQQTLQNIAGLAVPAFADYCMVDLLDEALIRPVAHAHIDPAKEALLVEKRRRFPLTIEHHHPVADVLRTGKPSLTSKTEDEDLVATAVNVDHLTILRRLIPRSSIVMPLRAREKTLGTITFTTGQAESGRVYDEADLVWAAEIAQRAALALDNARLYREAHEARQFAERSGTALAQINDELQQFTFATSHDLREPLRTIHIYTQLLQRRNDGKLDDQSLEFMNLILAGASRMDRLINALLDYSKAGEVTNEPLKEVDIEAVLTSTLAILGRTIEEAGAVVTHDPLPRIVGSELHIGQLLQNLIGNAVKYRREEPPHIHVSATYSDGRWLFMVSDNGQGIPPDQFSNIFLVFTRLHGHEYPGTGIGLATCRKIVERYGGRIWVESKVDQGSTFFFTLPGRPEKLQTAVDAG